MSGEIFIDMPIIMALVDAWPAQDVADFKNKLQIKPSTKSLQLLQIQKYFTCLQLEDLCRHAGYAELAERLAVADKIYPEPTDETGRYAAYVSHLENTVKQFCREYRNTT